MQRPLLHRIALRRFSAALCLPLLLLTGCRIERTPSPYIDRVGTSEQEVRAASEELVDRLLSTAPSLQRGNLTEVTLALAPRVDITGIGPDAEVIRGDTAFMRILTEMTAGQRIAMEDLRVDVEPGNDAAWFRSVFVLTDTSDATGRVPFTGVLMHQEGIWRLVQANLAEAVTPQADPPPSPEQAAAEAG